MKKLLLTIFSFNFIINVFADSGSFIVQGDADKYYPVTFYDGGWEYNQATELSIGRSAVGSPWLGSMIAGFRYHVTAWGHGSSFIDANIVQTLDTPDASFIAGWRDMSGANTSVRIIIWLKGGNTTYYYNSNFTVSPQVYDLILPLLEDGGPSHSYKTAIDNYVHVAGASSSRGFFVGGRAGVGIEPGAYMPASKFFVKAPVLENTVDKKVDIFTIMSGIGTNSTPDGWNRSELTAYNYRHTPGTDWQTATTRLQYRIDGLDMGFIAFNPPGMPWGISLGTNNQSRLYINNDGQVGIGTLQVNDNAFSLFVEKGIRTRRVKVDQVNWPDYVFEKQYKLPGLNEVEQFIQANKHLPGIPSAGEVTKNGLDLGDNQASLLMKIEELTLYLIQQNKKIEILEQQVRQLAGEKK